jgi:hypothetical protein
VFALWIPLWAELLLVGVLTLISALLEVFVPPARVVGPLKTHLSSRLTVFLLPTRPNMAGDVLVVEMRVWIAEWTEDKALLTIWGTEHEIQSDFLGLSGHRGNYLHSGYRL